MDIIDNFIYQHFDNIYAQVISGPDPIKREYLKTKDFGNNLCKWDLSRYLKDQFSIEGIKRNLYDSIRHFFYICLNSPSISVQSKTDREQSKINQNPYAGVAEKIKKQLYLACLQHESLMTADIYENYIGFTDQVIKYIFLYLNIGTERELRECQVRIDKFTNLLPQDMKGVHRLLCAMQSTRNKKAHYAYKYYTNKKDWLDQITYLLYDYITIFYYAKFIIKADWNKDAGYKRVKDITIKFSVETKTNQVKDLKVYLYPDNAKNTDNKSLYKIIQDNKNQGYKVELFKKYIICLDKDWSEPFEIDNKFTDGCSVIVAKPPFPKLDEPRLSISDIFNVNILPPEALFIIDSINDVRSKSPYGKEINMDLVKEIFLAIFSVKGNNQKNLIDSLHKLVEHNKETLINQMDIDNLFKVIDDKIYNNRKDKILLKGLLDRIEKLYQKLSSNNLEEYEIERCEKAIDNITLAALLDSENTIKNDSNTYDDNVLSAISKVDKALLKILDSDRSEDIHEEVSKILKTSEDCLYAANISNQIFTHILKLSEYIFTDELNSPVAVDKDAIIKMQKETYALDLKTKTLNMILNQNELNQVKLCVYFGNFIISNLVSTLSLIKSSELITDYSDYEKDINDFSIFIRNLMKQRDNSIFQLKSFGNEEWTQKLYEYSRVFNDYLAKADNNTHLYCNLLWLVRLIDNAMLLDIKEGSNLLSLLYEDMIKASMQIDFYAVFRKHAVTNNDFTLLCEYRNFIELIKEINNSYYKALLLDHNKGIDEENLVVERLIKIINEKYKNIDVPKYIKDIEETEIGIIPQDLKIRMLAICGEPYSDDANLESLNDYVLLIRLLAEINDLDSDLLNNEFIRSYIKEYLPGVSNPQLLDMFFDIMKDAKEYCRTIIRLILELGQDEISLELAYGCNFVDEHTPKKYGLSIREFIGYGYHKRFENSITPDEGGLLNLALCHSRRLSRLENWTKDSSEYENIVKTLRHNLMNKSTLYSLENFTEYAYNDLLGLKSTGKADFKLRILEYICKNNLINKNLYS